MYANRNQLVNPEVTLAELGLQAGAGATFNIFLKLGDDLDLVDLLHKQEIRNSFAGTRGADDETFEAYLREHTLPLEEYPLALPAYGRDSLSAFIVLTKP